MAESKSDWAEPKRDPKTGFQLHKDGLPSGKLARAMALAKSGKTADPEGIVTPSEIAAVAPPKSEPQKAASTAHTAKE